MVRCSHIVHTHLPHEFCYILYLGAFLIPYLLCLILAGVPVFLMEMSIGQVMQTNAVKAWKRICPLFGGKFSMCTKSAPKSRYKED
jgi:hypothetical protein